MGADRVWFLLNRRLQLAHGRMLCEPNHRGLREEASITERPRHHESRSAYATDVLRILEITTRTEVPDEPSVPRAIRALAQVREHDVPRGGAANVRTRVEIPADADGEGSA